MSLWTNTEDRMTEARLQAQYDEFDKRKKELGRANRKLKQELAAAEEQLAAARLLNEENTALSSALAEMEAELASTQDLFQAKVTDCCEHVTSIFGRCFCLRF